MTTPQTTPELLPCPFCGSADTYAMDMGGWESFCKTCGTNGPALNTERDKVITDWNTRAATQERAAPLEGVSDKYRDLLLEWLDGMYDSADFLRRVKLACGTGIKLVGAPESPHPPAPELARTIPPRFQHTYCQTCDGQFGPGDDGFINCQAHAHLSAKTRHCGFAEVGQCKAVGCGHLDQQPASASPVAWAFHYTNSGQWFFADTKPLAKPETIESFPIPLAALQAFNSRRPPVIPPGYALVPIELTAEMRGLLTAAEGDTITDGPALLEQLWGELLAAAPQPPASALPLATWPPTHLEDGSENPAWLTFKHGTLNPALEATRNSLPIAAGAGTVQGEEVPFCWCIDSENSADWCFSASREGVEFNAKLLDPSCKRSEPFKLYRHAASPPPPGGMVPLTVPIPHEEDVEGHLRFDERVNAARWNMLPAFLEKYQIDYISLLHDIDAVLVRRPCAPGLCDTPSKCSTDGCKAALASQDRCQICGGPTPCNCNNMEGLG